MGVGVEVPNPGGGFGSSRNVRSKCPGFAHRSNDVATGASSTTTLTFCPGSGGLIVMGLSSPLLEATEWIKALHYSGGKPASALRQAVLELNINLQKCLSFDKRFFQKLITMGK
jgi:hypothetical protein